MGSPSSRFSTGPHAWDLEFAEDADDTNPLTLMLVSDGEAAMWEGGDATALASDQVVYRERAIMWQPMAGVGHSRRTPETTTTGPDGQIVSVGTSYGNNVTTVVPGMALPAGKLTGVDLPGAITGNAGEFLDGAEYGADNDLYLTTSTRYLLKIPDGDGAVEEIDIFGGGYQTHSLQVFDGDLILSGGSTGPIFRLSGTNWANAQPDCTATVLARVNWMPSNAIMEGSGGGVPADHLILVDENGAGFYHVVSGNDVTQFSNWIGSGGGESIAVGPSNFPIRSVVAAPQTIWFSKTNGLYGFTETGRAVNLTPWIERSWHPTNGARSAFYSDEERAYALYTHQLGLAAVAVNGTVQQSATWMQFGSKTPNESPIWGRPRAIAPHTDCIFVGYYDNVNSYVMRVIFNADGSIRWSGSECTIEGEEITFLKVTSPGGRPRLWIGTQIPDTDSPRLYWQSLPITGNPWVDYRLGFLGPGNAPGGDDGHEVAPSWNVYLPRDDAGSSAEKVVRRYDLVGRQIADGNSVIVDASADDGEYVEQGTVTEGPRASFIATTYQSGVTFDWRVRCNNSTVRPIALEAFQARMSVLPEQVDVWTFRCQLAAGQGIHNDAEDLQDPYTVRARVRALQRRGPIHLRRSPLSRETLTVKIEQGSRIQAVKLRASNSTVVVLTLTVSVLQQAALYGVDVYGAGEFGVDD